LSHKKETDYFFAFLLFWEAFKASLPYSSGRGKNTFQKKFISGKNGCLISPDSLIHLRGEQRGWRKTAVLCELKTGGDFPLLKNL
jgi:hypothetical protein